MSKFSKFRSVARPKVLRLAVAVAGMAMAATLAHGQVATETGVLAATAPNPPNATPSKSVKQKPVAKVKPAELAPMASVSGNVELAPQINLTEGKSTLVRLPFPAKRLSVGDVSIADVILLNPSEVYMLGKSIGSTNLILWDRSGNATIIDIAVGIDIETLRSRFEQLLPGGKDIKITAAGSYIVLSGTVSDVVKADQAMELACAYVDDNANGGVASGAGGVAPAPAPSTQITNNVSMSPQQQSNPCKVRNMLTIAAPQQVMLEVKVAEIDKTILDKLGANFSAMLNRGSWAATLVTNFLSGSPGALNLTKSNGNTFGIDAQNQHGLVKILAEPTIMAISGQQGSFLAGGKIFIPVPQSSSGAGGTTAITLQEEEFGVGLRFTPTVLDGGRINLKVAPEVSELSSTGAQITAPGTSLTSVVPLITTRRAATTVQLLDGQSFAIAGLIKNNVTQNINAFPMLGEIPILGALFRSSSFQTDKTELVFIVTPHLVKPLPADYVLPTDQLVVPSRGEFFLGGKMEGSPSLEEKKPVTPPTGFEVK